MMKTKSSILLSGLLGVLPLILFLAILPSTNPMLPKSEVLTADEEAIREVLNKRRLVEADAHEVFDPSLMESIYTNEPGPKCPVSENDLKVLQFIRQDDTLRADQVGIPDAMQAGVLWSKQANEKVQIIVAQMIAEGRITMTQEEKESLQDETGLPYPDPLLPISYPPPSYKPPYDTKTSYTNTIESIESITFTNPERATAIVLFIEGAFRTEYTLVKIGDSWRISCAQRIYGP